MEDNNENLMNQMEETRSSLSEKLGALESHLEKKAEPIVAAVERTTEAAAEIVEDMKETINDVKEKVQETVQDVKEKVADTVTAVGSMMDIRKQTERHPWVVFGLAATTGCLLGTLLGRRTQTPQEQAATSAARQKHSSRNGNGWSHRKETREKAAGKSDEDGSRGVIGEELHRITGLAIAALMGTIREMASRSFPGSFGNQLSQEIDDLTVRLGAQPLVSPVLGSPGAECKTEQSDHPQGTYENRIRSTGQIG